MKENTYPLQFALQYFLDTPDEKIVIAERTHWIFPTLSSLAAIVLSIPFSALVFLLTSHIVISVTIAVAIWLVLGLFVFSLITKIIVDWYFHMYVITNKKALEIRYSPLLSHVTNGILLDQVRCTEIDERKTGIIRELFDIGNITITFDRPTHEEEFTLYDIQHSSKVSLELRNFFASLQNIPAQQIIVQNSRRHPLVKRTLFSSLWGSHYVS